MTALLTGREIEWTKIQVDMRKPKMRRQGERNGSFSWAVAIDIFVVIVIAVAIAYTGFMLGRHYETISKQETVSQAVIWKEYKAAKVQGH